MPAHIGLPRTRRRTALWIALGVLTVALFLAVAVPLYATSKPAFYGSYQRFAQRYETWKTSEHRNVSCEACHVGAQDGVVYRATLVAEFYAGRRSTKPVLASLPPATAEGCRQCHGQGRSFDLARLMKVPHPAHQDLAQEKRDCVRCHKWVAHSEKYQEKHKTIAFTGICMNFGCHSGTKTQKECRFCHHSQTYSQVTWRRVHPAVVAARGENNCMDYCHKPSQCRECHETGKNPFTVKSGTPKTLTGLIAKHSSPNWDAEHGREAQQGRERCFYCHGSYEACRECHSRRPAFHGPKATWLGRHQKIGKNKERCLACHDAKECTDCHNVFKEGR